jgi:hypothetical protein
MTTSKKHTASKTTKSLKAQLEAMRAENARLLSARPKAPPKTLKVSSKGGVSPYGIGRFPASFYKSQWLAILDMMRCEQAARQGKFKTTLRDELLQDPEVWTQVLYCLEAAGIDLRIRNDDTIQLRWKWPTNIGQEDAR